MSIDGFAREVDGRFFDKFQEQGDKFQTASVSSRAEHSVQFYESEEFLLDSLYEFTRGGLDTGESIVVVASSEHCRRLSERLDRSGLDLAAAAKSNQFIVLDADEVLARFMVGEGMPDETLFARVIGEIIEKAARKERRVKVFGEMVAVLLAEGNHRAALRLEQLWNELQKTFAFTLYCAYPIRAFDGCALSPVLGEVCAGHSHVLPAESFTALADDKSRFRKVTEWQQKARSLENEIEERKRVEDELREAREELETQVGDLRRLHEMSLRLTGALDVKQILEEVLQAALSVQKTDMGLLILCADQGQVEEEQRREGLNPKMHSGISEDFLKAIEFVPVMIGGADGGGGGETFYQTKRQIVVEDTESDPIFAGYRNAARSAGFRACHNTPLVTREGNITGVLSVYFRHPRRPLERETRLMDLYAQMAADVIEKARLLEREQAARMRAEEANRMKDEFVATVSHELRTPLNAIVGWSHLLKENCLDESKTERAIGAIDRNARLQARLIEDLLDVSRVISGKLCLKIEPVDPISILEEAVNFARPEAKSKNIQIVTETLYKARHFEADSSRIQQIVWNLLTNAIKFTEPGGRVEVRLTSDESSVAIAVKDSGRGIHPKVLPYIFENFRQGDGSTTRRHGGMGLGLAIVKHLTELHGGTVEADSEGEGKGATFTVRLPHDAFSNAGN